MKPELKLELLKEIKAVVPIPLVLHGGSNNPDLEIGIAARTGINKINISSDIKMGYHTRMREVMADDPNLREPDDPAGVHQGHERGRGSEDRPVRRGRQGRALPLISTKGERDVTTHQLVLGLGGCVDFEIAWDPGMLEMLAREYRISAAELDADIPVEDERSLLCSISPSSGTVSGGERYIASSDIAVRFASLFSCKVSLGGTCVRAALAIARLGVPSLVHLVSIDDNMRRLLAPGIDYLSSATRDTLDPHLIVQFPAGATVDWTAARSVRPSQPHHLRQRPS